MDASYLLWASMPIFAVLILLVYYQNKRSVEERKRIIKLIASDQKRRLGQ